MNTQKRDFFELLSAYLDGEVTSTEKRQVEERLNNDAETQKLYARLLALRQNFQTLPVPPASQSVEQTIQQVFGKIEKRRQYRSLKWAG
ncbi:MAG: zf-HC2 domain-containing protein, partial [Tatlockia sp.]|nr:zf-HC2 domain-containing protein [Tatlockia sp.]